VQTADHNFTHPRFHRDKSFQVSMRLGETPGVVNASSSVIASSCISSPSMNRGGKVYVNFMGLEEVKQNPHRINICYLKNADGGNQSREGTDSGDPSSNHKRNGPVCVNPTMSLELKVKMPSCTRTDRNQKGPNDAALERHKRRTSE
jgi:hypothetical protein